jgi:hypothetical protein
MTGVIYLLVEEEEGGGETDFCKIGYTSNFHERMRDIQVGNARELLCIANFPGTLSLEKEIQKTLVTLRIRSEWFRHADAIYDAFEDIQEMNFIAETFSGNDYNDQLIIERFRKIADAEAHPTLVGKE